MERPKSNRSAISTGLAALLLLTQPAAGMAGGGQDKSRPASSREDYDSVRARHLEMRQREMRLKAEGRPASSEQLMALAAIKKDFERMQAINNEMMRRVHGEPSIDYKDIWKRLAEINKCARRLKQNLKLPAVDKKPDNPDQPQGRQIVASLSSLDDAIMSFVRNPIFQNTNLIAADQLDRAARDLGSVIGLSDAIRKDAERLCRQPATFVKQR